MKLKWKKGMERQERQRAIETSLFLGFQSIAAEFPIVSKEEGMDIPLHLTALEALLPAPEKGRPDDYIEAVAACEIPELDFRKERGLELLFSKGPFLKDENYDMLPDVLDVKLVLPYELDDSMTKVACDLAFRLGMETTAYKGPIIAPDHYVGNAIFLEIADTCKVWQEIDEKGYVCVHIAGHGEELEKFVSLLCMEFPRIHGNRTWQDWLMDLCDSMAMKNLDGELAHLESTRQEGAALEAYLSPEYQQVKGKIEEYFQDIKFYDYKDGEAVYKKNYEIPWEVDEFETLMNENVYPKIKQGDRVSLFAALSEESDLRSRVAEGIQSHLMKQGAIIEDVQVLCAYKQGFSWMSETVIPELMGKKVAQVMIQFRPFLPPGQTKWNDEDGATPSHRNLQEDTPDKWYDLPIRYLQELYPVEDVICSELGIARDQVLFQTYDGTQDITYQIQALDAEGQVIHEDCYKAWCSERPYLDEYSYMGKVHPSTGYVIVKVNGEIVLQQRIETDVERVWDIYQKEVLPDCRRYVETIADGNIRESAQPFFRELQLEVAVSEPDYRLESREDLISSLDALHEDMYFAGTDYFKNFGMVQCGAALDAPGLILPLIHKAEGKPKFEVTLFRQLRQEATIEKEGQVLKRPVSREETGAFISSIGYVDGRMVITIKVQAQEDVVHAYAKLFQEDILEECDSFSHVGKIILEGNQNCYEIPIKESVRPEKTRSIVDIDLSEQELIGYERCMEIIEQLKDVPGIEVFRVAKSYMGRDIYAIELLPREKGYVSRTKRINRLPSEIINTRHHANEVSGTNGMLILLKKLLTEKAWEELPDKLNLVMVPMENVDGAALHYELQKEHPYWKFHVARFNAIGKEFYYEHFQQETIHREAMGLTRLFHRYIPDMVVDNHGVPSHEWEQQFSGYTSPSFKGFWLPRSLLYGYFWTVTDDAYRSNYPVNKKMEDVIADEIAKDEEMTRWNKEWSQQFEKYAHAFMPRLFPANYYKDMINYWIPFPYDKAHRYPSIRFPWITTVAYTSEVADETAQGDYLYLCAKAHVAHDIATLRMLVDSRSVFEQSCEITENQVSISDTRKRPIIVG